MAADYRKFPGYARARGKRVRDFSRASGRAWVPFKVARSLYLGCESCSGEKACGDFRISPGSNRSATVNEPKDVVPPSGFTMRDAPTVAVRSHKRNRGLWQ